MSLSTKVITLMLALFATYAGVDYAIQRQVIYPSFAALEREEAQKNTARAIEALQRELELLGPSAADWANWDDTYNFVADGNEAYIEANLNAPALASLKVNFLGIYDLEGRLVWGLAVDPDSEAELARPAFLADRLPLGHPLRSDSAATEPVSGLLRTPAGPVLFVSHPILTSDGAGPARGNVIMGRLLDAAAITRIAAQTRIDLRMQAPGGVGGTAAADLAAPAANGGLLSHTPIRLVESPGASMSYTTLVDLEGQPALWLLITTPREITARGADALHHATLSNALAGGLILLTLLMLLRRTVLDPLGRLTRHAAALGAGDDLSLRLASTRQDEIGVLSREFDRMVQRLAETRQKLLEQSYKSGVAEMASGVLHNIGNAITPIGVKLNKLKTALGEAPVREIDLAAGELADPALDPGRRVDMHGFLALAGQELAALVRRTTQDLDAVHTQFDHVQQILADQQRFSRAERVVEALPVAPLLRDTIKLMPDGLRERLRIELAGDLGQLPPVRGSRVALQQVLSNLLINAAEAIGAQQPGELQVEAALETLDGAALVHLRFTDNGAGIAPEHLAHLFERGFSTKARGSGMGLHWSANTVLALGGRLYAESAGAGRGACFHLLLPQALAAQPGLEHAA